MHDYRQYHFRLKPWRLRVSSVGQTVFLTFPCLSTGWIDTDAVIEMPLHEFLRIATELFEMAKGAEDTIRKTRDELNRNLERLNAVVHRPNSNGREP